MRELRLVGPVRWCAHCRREIRRVARTQEWVHVHSTLYYCRKNDCIVQEEHAVPGPWTR